MAMKFTPAQLRAARAHKDWDRAELYAESGVTPRTILNFERGHTEGMTAKNQQAIIHAFYAAGIVFMRELEGIRLRKDTDPAPKMTDDPDEREASADTAPDQSKVRGIISKAARMVRG